MSKKKIFTELIALILFIAAVFGTLHVAAAVLRPKVSDYGADWNSFLAEEEDSLDVIFFGSSMVYCDIVPAVIWRESGLTSYVLGGGEQTVPMSYYYIREALRTQSPQAVCLELSGMFFPKYTDFQESNIGYMPFSVNRVKAAFETASPSMSPILAVCPPSLLTVAKQHHRISALTSDDFRYAFSPGVHQAGYTFLSKIETWVPGDTVRPTVIDEENYAFALEYLRKIEELCREEGIKLFLYIAPSAYRYSGELIARLRSDVEFTDFNDVFDSIGIDLSRDFFDILHFNCYGAETFSKFISPELLAFGVVPSDPDRLSELWQARLDQFDSRVSSLGS